MDVKSTDTPTIIYSKEVIEYPLQIGEKKIIAVAWIEEKWHDKHHVSDIDSGIDYRIISPKDASLTEEEKIAVEEYLDRQNSD